MQITISATVKAPPEVTAGVYGDYGGWPRIFPTISHVRLVDEDGPARTLEIQHSEGLVINRIEVKVVDETRYELRLDEWKRAYDATFTNIFQGGPDRPGQSTFTIVGEIRLKGWRRYLAPLIRPYARRLMRRLQMEPVKTEAEKVAAGGSAA
jgi:hypothetical protein